jgi:hypothetical protein
MRSQCRRKPSLPLVFFALGGALTQGRLACGFMCPPKRNRAPGELENFIKPLWKQGVGSTIHCIAGDATGIIVADVITAVLGLPMWIDLTVEYTAGFAFGLWPSRPEEDHPPHP